MVKKRWYDQEPTISMAVSLLQNASTKKKIQTSQYVLDWLGDEGALESQEIAKLLKPVLLFPFLRRESLNQSTWQLLEVMKELPKDLQLEVSLNMIQFIYKLDSGFVLEDDVALEVELRSS